MMLFITRCTLDAMRCVVGGVLDGSAPRQDLRGDGQPEPGHGVFPQRPQTRRVLFRSIGSVGQSPYDDIAGR